MDEVKLLQQRIAELEQSEEQLRRIYEGHTMPLSSVPDLAIR